MNKKSKKLLTVILSLCMVAVSLFTGSIGVFAFSPTKVSAKIKPLTNYSGNTVTLINDDIRELMDMDYFDWTYIITLYEEGENNYAPNDIVLSWEEVASADYYNVKVATDRDFNNVVDRYAVIGKNAVKVNIPLIDTEYFWQVETEVKGEKIVSGIFSFKTADTPRTLFIDGVTNTRDLGGYTTSLGVMAQNRVFRGAKLENITSAGKITAKKLGIKTDLDLRSPGEIPQKDKSPLDVNYINVDAPYYATYSDMAISDSRFYPNVKEIMQVFADANNYPIYMHCTYGKDRTGTFAFLLGALCGKNLVQLKQDFWLSVYSVDGAISKDKIKSTWEQFELLYTFIDGQVGRTFAEKTETYLKTVGLTQKQLDSIKANILVQE